MQDIRTFHEQFYSNDFKSAQDNVSLKHTQQALPKRCQAGKRSTRIVIKIMFVFLVTPKVQEMMLYFSQ